MAGKAAGTACLSYRLQDCLLQMPSPGVAIFVHGVNSDGPFANGCSALPGLWGQGLCDALFLWLHTEHLNPVNDRIVSACPPRPYIVMAAWRLAHLAAAFLGNKMADVQGAAGKSGRCAACASRKLPSPNSALKRSAVAEDA